MAWKRVAYQPMVRSGIARFVTRSLLFLVFTSTSVFLFGTESGFGVGDCQLYDLGTIVNDNDCHVTI